MIDRQTIDACKDYALELIQTVNHYPYHNIAHTLEVFDRVGYLCGAEKISDMDTTDLLIAALFHDTGFTSQYASNEPIGASIACEYLAMTGYDPDRIETIEHYILATTIGAVPQNIGEGIIQDSDLDNLGRTGSYEKTELLYCEIKDYGHIDISWGQWLQNTYNFAQKFKYHTATSQHELDATKEYNITRLAHEIEKFKTKYS